MVAVGKDEIECGQALGKRGRLGSTPAPQRLLGTPGRLGAGHRFAVKDLIQPARKLAAVIRIEQVDGTEVGARRLEKPKSILARPLERVLVGMDPPRPTRLRQLHGGEHGPAYVSLSRVLEDLLIGIEGRLPVANQRAVLHPFP